MYATIQLKNVSCMIQKEGRHFMKKTNDNFIMLPTNDFCFTELMQNPIVRKGFLAALLKIRPDEIKETTVLSRETRRSSEDDKYGILDVKIELWNGTIVDVEMQVECLDYWSKRILFYLSKMYTDQIKKGESYNKLKKCIHVSILDFIHFPEDNECYRVIRLHDEKTGALYTDLFELHILELKKLPKDIQTEDAIIQWMRFFGGQSKEEFEIMSKENEYIDEAYNELKRLSANDIKRYQYEARQKMIRDHNSAMDYAKRAGTAQGMEKGIILAKNVFKAYYSGKTVEEIAEEYEITAEKVNEILE